MRGINNENTFIIVDGDGKGVAEVSDRFAAKYPLKFPFVYLRPSDYLPTLNKNLCIPVTNLTAI